MDVVFVLGFVSFFHENKSPYEILVVRKTMRFVLDICTEDYKIFRHGNLGIVLK